MNELPLVLSTRKDSLESPPTLDGSSSHSPLERVPSTPLKLDHMPGEIRNEIWKMAAAEKRLFIARTEWPLRRFMHFLRSPPPPTVMLLCKESRAAAEREGIYIQKQWFHPHSDILYLTNDWYLLQNPIENIWQVRHLALSYFNFFDISVVDGLSRPQLDYLKLMERFPRLETLGITVMSNRMHDEYLTSLCSNGSTPLYDHGYPTAAARPPRLDPLPHDQRICLWRAPWHVRWKTMAGELLAAAQEVHDRTLVPSAGGDGYVHAYEVNCLPETTCQIETKPLVVSYVLREGHEPVGSGLDDDEEEYTVARTVKFYSAVTWPEDY